MALTPEDGTGLANADTFATLAEADAFWAAREIMEWAAASAPKREAALRAAADYLAFGYVWPGQPLKTTQALCWPRSAALDKQKNSIAPNIVPIAVERAQILLAREALTQDLLRQTDADDSAVVRESVTVGKVSESKEYAASSRKGVDLQSFVPVDAVLADIVLSRRGRTGFRSVPLVRK